MIINSFRQILTGFCMKFLSLFQISDVKPELSPVKLKVHKMAYFGLKPISKKFSQVIFVPQSKLCEQIGSK